MIIFERRNPKDSWTLSISVCYIISLYGQWFLLNNHITSPTLCYSAYYQMLHGHNLSLWLYFLLLLTAIRFLSSAFPIRSQVLVISCKNFYGLLLQVFISLVGLIFRGQPVLNGFAQIQVHYLFCSSLWVNSRITLVGNLSRNQETDWNYEFESFLQGRMLIVTF